MPETSISHEQKVEKLLVIIATQLINTATRDLHSFEDGIPKDKVSEHNQECLRAINIIASSLPPLTPPETKESHESIDES